MDKAMVDMKDLEDSESIASNDQSFEVRLDGIKSKLNTKQMKLEVSESPKEGSKSMHMNLRDLEDSESIASNDRSFEDIERVIKSKLNMTKVEVSEILKKDSKSMRMSLRDLEDSESIASLKEDSKSMSMSLRDLEDSESIASNSIQEENPTRMNFRAKFSSDSTSSLDENLTPFQVALSSELKEVAKSKAHLSTDDNFDYDGDEGTSSGDSDSVFYKEIPRKSFQHKFEPRRQFDQVPRSEQMSTPDQMHQELLFDSHCHIDIILSRAFNKPASAFFKPGPQPLQLLKDTYTMAFTSTFEGCINVITHPNQFDTKFWDWLDEPEMYLAIGCHPENSKSYDLIAEETLKESLEHPKVIALGEIGLDDVWEKRGISFKTQTEAFERQLNIAMLKKKPLVMHIRGAQSSKLAKDIMRKVNLPNNWRIHMHCFTDTWKQCKEWADEWPEMKFGFTSDSFFAEVIENLSTSKILLETDAPYFLPEKVKKELGWTRPALPSDVWFVAQQVAYFKKITVMEVLYANRINISNIYGIPWPTQKVPCPPLRAVELTFACNGAISNSKPIDKDNLEEEYDLIHVCGGSFKVARK